MIELMTQYRPGHMFDPEPNTSNGGTFGACLIKRS